MAGNNLERDIRLKGAERQLSECHLMPCRIECKSSTVMAKEYFVPLIKRKKDKSEEVWDEVDGDKKTVATNKDLPLESLFTASFRGRPLEGCQVQLPEGYKCVAASKEPKSEAGGEFNKFTYWNWDKQPDKEDSIQRAFQWIAVAKAIHDDSE